METIVDEVEHGRTFSFPKHDVYVDNVPPIGSPCYEARVPFPLALQEMGKRAYDEDLYEIFKNSEIKVALFDLIKSIPKHARILKKLCSTTKNTNSKANTTGKVSEHVSSIFHEKFAQKWSDPGMFTIPCTIDDKKINNALLDLGASINVIPTSLYESLNIGPLKDTNVVIQLADRSSTRPRGVVENMLVKVDKLIFPA